MAKVPPLNSWEYVWGNPTEAPRTSGVPGQNTPNPLAHFFRHVVMKISGTYYDPSYGTTFASRQDWEDNTVAGFIISDVTNKRFLLRENFQGAFAKVDTEEALVVYTGQPLPGAP